MHSLINSPFCLALYLALSAWVLRHARLVDTCFLLIYISSAYSTQYRMDLLLVLFSVAFPLLCFVTFLFVRSQDADFMLIFYEYLGLHPTDTLGGKVVWIIGASSGIGERSTFSL